MRSLAIIGSVGIPNRYGGFESFAEQIAPELARNGSRVIVTCDAQVYAGDDCQDFNGVERHFIHIGANGASSPLHDFLAYISVAWRVDRVLVLGVSGGLLFPFFRMLTALLGAAPFFVNIDGVEWQRGKFGVFRKAILFISDALAQWSAHGVIYDNSELAKFVRFKKKSVCIAYSGDHVVTEADLLPPAMDQEEYALTICRIEPENNCEMLIEGFLGSSVPRYVFVGNWDNSEYGRALRKKYESENRLVLKDPTFDKAELNELRTRCRAYLHGHSVGGTNPSLVEMLFYDAAIFCFDCPYHRATAGNCANYFKTRNELSVLLNRRQLSVPVDRSAARTRYSRAKIAEQLYDFLQIR